MYVCMYICMYVHECVHGHSYCFEGLISMQVFDLGRQNRSTGATKMNIESSRSHALLCVTVAGENLTTGTQTFG